jgi:hypothetical protein
MQHGSENSTSMRQRISVVVTCVVLFLVGCQPTAPAPPAPATPAKQVAKSPGKLARRETTTAQPPQIISPPKPVVDTGGSRHTLRDLVAAARETEFELPPIDDDRIAAASIRKIEGQHLTLYTDLPLAAEIEELPRVFDAAVPLWAEYFGIDPAELNDWKLRACLMRDRQPFERSGLYSPARFSAWLQHGLANLAL